MVIGNTSECPRCGGALKYYDRVKRIVRTKGRETNRIFIRRFRCVIYGMTHRELPKTVVPYKQYGADIISGVVEGHITPDTLGYEDYPCEVTMLRWIYSLTHPLYF